MTIQYRPDSKVPCVVMRGGTTRGFFFRPEHIPSDPAIRDRLLLDIVAGEDLRAADGLGGNDMLLNKVVEVWPSTRPDADVECTFGVITPGSGRVKYGSNCGNLVSAVALYAIEEGLCTSTSATVRLFNPQANARVDARFMDTAEFRERAARAKSMGMVLSGVPVELAFIDPASTIGRGLLPSGRAVDRLRLPSGTDIDASIVDSGTVYVFIAANDLGLDHAIAPLASEQRRELLEIAEHLRGQAAVLCGLVDRPEDALRLSPAVPKISIVSPPRDYVFDNGRDGFAGHEVDMLGRVISSQNFHTSYAVTGAMATIGAAVVPDSVVNRAIGGAVSSPIALKIGHPSGMIEPRQDWRATDDGVVVERAYAIRTTRRLMTGTVHLTHLAQPHEPSRTNVVTAVPTRTRTAAVTSLVPGVMPR